MKRNIVSLVALGVLLVALVARFSATEDDASTPSSTSVPRVADAPTADGSDARCASGATGSSDAPPDGVTTTLGPGHVYDPDGSGPAPAQVPLGDDPSDPSGSGGDAPTPSTAGGTVLTYDPSATRGGSTYTVFADLVEAASSVKGGGTIYVPNDATIDAPGNYDLNSFGFASNGSTRGFSRTILTIPDGVTFTDPGYVLSQGALVLYSTSRAAVVTVEAESAESSRMFILENDGLVASQRAAFFTLTASAKTSYVFISMRHGGGVAKPSDLGIGGGDFESISANAGAGFVVLASVAPPDGFYDGTVRGEGTVVWNRYTTAAASQGVPVARGRLQPNAANFVELILGSTALSTHQQANPDDWLAPDGTTNAASLDELACRVHALEAGD